MNSDRYAKLESIAAKLPAITQLFKLEPKRMETFVLREGPLRADFSKQAMSGHAREQLLHLAADCQLEHWREQFFAGEKINTTEDRAVLHPALRGVGGDQDVQKQVSDMRAKLRGFAEKVCSEAKYKSIVHVGIGGSDLGPRLIADGLAASTDNPFELRFAENVDGASINDALNGLDPKTTLVIVVSKSFTTQETRMNAESARDWLEGAFDFWDWVGGRYSVWSAVGLSLQIAFGPDAFDDFLAGAAAMDTHFRYAFSRCAIGDQPAGDDGANGYLE